MTTAVTRAQAREHENPKPLKKKEMTWKLLDHAKPFVLRADALNCGLDGVLMQKHDVVSHDVWQQEIDLIRAEILHFREGVPSHRWGIPNFDCS